MFTYFCRYFLDILWIIFYIIGIFYLGIALLSLLPSKYKKTSDVYLKFAVVIPAHNEEKVIKNLLCSLNNQEYPSEYYKTYIMADNCVDETVYIALNLGANVMLRSSDEIKGKGAALSDAFAQLHESSDYFDACIVIDADNIVDKNFLKEINITMLQGNRAVQGYIDSKNPANSWVSYAHSVWYWITNHILQKGFSDSGIGCCLGGTGFALSKSLLDEIAWDVNSLAEDAEYTAKLCVSGEKIRFAPSAVIFDEKPRYFKESVYQRTRWAKGIFCVSKKYSGLLLKKGKLLDFLKTSSNWLMPLTFFVLAFLTVFVWLELMGIIEWKMLELWLNPLNIFALTFYTLGMIFSSFVALVQDKKFESKIILNTIGFLFYIISWIPIGIYGVFKYRKKEWYHTKHRE